MVEKTMKEIKWLSEVEDHDYPSARSSLPTGIIDYVLFMRLTRTHWFIARSFDHGECGGG